jgi:hypothetical protein
MGKPKPYARALQRAQWVITFIETLDVAAANKASGLGSRGRHQVLRCLKENRCLEDAPRSGRPVKYTKQVLDKAVDMLLEVPRRLLTLRKLLHQLVEDGTVSGPVDVKNFGRHLTAHVAATGHSMITNSRGSVFFLAKGDKQQRVRFCKATLRMLLGGKVPHDWVFLDEVTFEECPHPKGEWSTSWDAGCCSRLCWACLCCAVLCLAVSCCAAPCRAVPCCAVR